jgi:hypothetical protein
LCQLLSVASRKGQAGISLEEWCLGTMGWASPAARRSRHPVTSNTGGKGGRG